MSTLKEIKGNLKQAGFKKEDIGVTLRLFLCLESLDKLVFTESPVTVNFVSGKNPFEYFTGYHQRRNGEEIYNIYVNGIAALIREENKQGFLYLPSGPKNQCAQLPMRLDIASRTISLPRNSLPEALIW